MSQQTHAKSAFKIECDHCHEDYIILNVQLTVTVQRYKETNTENNNG